jgi:protein-S-isoprenylcysteine O-methyltransferase Ste14
VIPIPRFSPNKIAPLPASLLLIATAIGSVVLAGIALVTLVPLVMIVGGMVIAIVATLLLGWAGIEALAAFERWMDRDPRFQR